VALADPRGPFYQREEGDDLIVELHITARHANTRGSAYGACS